MLTQAIKLRIGRFRPIIQTAHSFRKFGVGFIEWLAVFFRFGSRGYLPGSFIESRFKFARCRYPLFQQFEPGKYGFYLFFASRNSLIYFAGRLSEPVFCIGDNAAFLFIPFFRFNTIPYPKVYPIPGIANTHTNRATLYQYTPYLFGE